MANSIEPIFQVGKGGINENMVAQIVDVLEARELIKVTILQAAHLDTRQTCDEMARLTGAEPVQSVGHRFVLYKRSKDNPQIDI